MVSTVGCLAAPLVSLRIGIDTRPEAYDTMIKKYAEFSVEASDTPVPRSGVCSMFAGPIGRDEYEEYRSGRRGKLVLLVSATARPVPFNDGPFEILQRHERRVQHLEKKLAVRSR
jgi:hypothetical protein